ncbi:hypothetical protein TMatcc_008836 [Talaromyces marneffei ATCC 18224]|uniref:DUF567 domain protein n=1 Tax=Talaromyces marneffei (strain ATCC 18224 / CBS 334.59 / QM 7333) TaxID=441960 RepID=B6QKW4_TALMQ|nr:uncharacterized protein EYB26_008148 [Talaromyces marneffei]EEA21741.1 conserved hypothetical protein [Talaromyces marneffei ATCC 18224]KAE8550780.1 hypothetical protein EYB25_007008 [Talaromyces marneffei]QGA20446.1 hypothetical protein EYB26_008148 [Talaromyces marneffei]
METILEPQAFPVAITDGFIQAGETTIIMQCHDRLFNDVDVRDQSNELLFTVESKGVNSMSWRRTVKDVTGTPLFQLRKLFKYGVDRKWSVEDPSGLELCSLRHVSTFRQFHALDVTVLNQADGGKESAVNVRPKDQVGITVQVKIRGATVAEIQMTEANHSHINFTEDRSVWKAHVAGGVDLTLIIAIMLCRAEMQHSWKQ